MTSHSLVLRDYGSGMIEWGYRFQYGSGGGDPDLQPRDPPVRDPEASAISNAQRARVGIRRAIMERKCDYMVTLTYRENMVDRGRAVDDLRLWIDGVRAALGSFVWVAVPERQERGAWHWHIAVKGWQNLPVLRGVWKRVVGEGAVNIRAPRGSGRPRWGRLRLAYYLMKYISKSVDNDGDRGKGVHRYFRDRVGVEVDLLRLSFTKTYELTTMLQRLLAGMKITARQEAADAYGGWGCSWSHPFRSRKKMA